MIFACAAADSEEGPEQQPRTSHLSRRDLRLLALAFVVFLVIMLPIYGVMKRRTEKHVCLSNIKAIGAAMLLYANNNTDRLPPTHVIQYPPTAAPLIVQGEAITWVTVVSDYMNRRTDFQCPTAVSEEHTLNAGVNPKSQQRGKVPSDFGMYAAYSGFPIEFVERPSDSLLLAETSNFGAKRTYNPVPFTDASGSKVPFDAFMIGWDTGNVAPSPATKSATRLAFYNTEDGVFSIEKPGRHEEGIHFLFVDMHYEVLRAPAAEVAMRNGLPAGKWVTPPPSASAR